MSLQDATLRVIPIVIRERVGDRSNNPADHVATKRKRPLSGKHTGLDEGPKLKRSCGDLKRSKKQRNRRRLVVVVRAENIAIVTITTIDIDVLSLHGSRG